MNQSKQHCLTKCVRLPGLNADFAQKRKCPSQMWRKSMNLIVRKVCSFCMASKRRLSDCIPHLWMVFMNKTSSSQNAWRVSTECKGNMNTFLVLSTTGSLLHCPLLNWSHPPNRSLLKRCLGFSAIPAARNSTSALQVFEDQRRCVAVRV